MKETTKKTDKNNNTINLNIFTFIFLLSIAFIIGVLIGRSYNPIQAAFRRADNIGSKTDIEMKKKSIILFNKLTDEIKLAILNASTQDRKRIVALSLSKMLISKQMWPEAIEYLKIVESIKPGDSEMNYQMGFCYLNLYNLEKEKAKKDNYLKQAEYYLEKAYLIIPDDADLNYLLSLLRYNQKDYKESLKHLSVYINKSENSLMRDENYIDALSLLAKIYFEIGQYENSKKVYNKLLSILPANSPKIDIIEKNIEIINKQINR